MPAFRSLGRALLAALLGLAIGSARARAGEDTSCKTTLQVIGATAVYKTPMFKGRPTRRDAAIEVELSSSSTAAVAVVELAIFLGASLRSIEDTRISSLPTARPRELGDGGLAFRVEATTFIAPGATRTVRIEKESLPLDRDLSSVTALVAGCRTVRPVGDAVVEPPRKTEGEPQRGVFLAAALIGALALVVVLVRVLR